MIKQPPAVHAITDIRSMRAVIKTLIENHSCPKYLYVDHKILEKIIRAVVKQNDVTWTHDTIESFVQVTYRDVCVRPPAAYESHLMWLAWRKGRKGPKPRYYI